ncbi:MAG: TolC family protein [Bryobacteraceae bacterium]
MRTTVLFLLLAALVSAQEPALNNLVTSSRTPTADAPAFGTGAYFRKIWNPTPPRVELKVPIQLTEFVQEGKLELSMKNYIDAVLANNTDIQIQRISIELPRNNILRQYSIFDPLAIASFTATRRQSPTSTSVEGADVLNQLSQPFQLRATQLLPTGTTYNVNFDTLKTSNNNQLAFINPAINSGLNFNVSQPLLRGRGMYLTKLPITIARSRLRSNEFSIYDTLLRLVTAAELTYWDVISARENLRVQEQALALYDTSLKRSQRELELGAISQLDIYQPQAQYANAEIQVTQARYRLQQVEDTLRRQMGADLDPQIRTLPIVLTEDVAPPVQTALDKEALVERAIRQRPDLKAARQNIDVDDLSIQNNANLLRPDLRLTGNYGSSGRGGNFLRAGNTVGFGGTLNEVLGFTYPAYVSTPCPADTDRRVAAGMPIG